jgi:hypothetical protein
MLSRLLPVVLVTMIVGCATRPQPTITASTTQTYVEPAAPRDYATTASALVFDPPTSRYLPPLDLSRDGRYPAAFAGYQQATDTFTYSWTYDRQSTDFRDSYDRNTFTVQVGSSVR